MKGRLIFISDHKYVTIVIRPEEFMSEEIFCLHVSTFSRFPAKTHSDKNSAPEHDFQTATAPSSVLEKSCGFHQWQGSFLVNIDMSLSHLTYIRDFLVGTTMYADVILAIQH